MATNNPKVSAYLPQHIFDSFKHFCDQRGMKMSQAVAVIFAEYFQVDYQVNRGSLPISGLDIARVEALEEQIQNLVAADTSLLGELLSKLRNLEGLVVQIESRLLSVEAKQSSESPKKPTNIPPKVIDQKVNLVEQLNMLPPVDTPPLGDPSSSNVQQPDNDLIVGELQIDQSGSLSETTDTSLAINPIFVGTNELNSDSIELPVDYDSSSLFEFPFNDLCLRLGVTYSLMSNRRSYWKNDKEKFFDWMQSKDIDNIRWVEAGARGRLILHKPADDTPSELLSRLKKWIKKNLEKNQS